MPNKKVTCIMALFIVGLMIAPLGAATRWTSHVSRRLQIRNFPMELNNFFTQTDAASTRNATQNVIQPLRLPPPPPTVTIYIHIYDSEGALDINGVSYSNGQSVSLNPDYSYTVSVGSIGQMSKVMVYSFLEWISNAGSFSNQTSSTTTFYPNGKNGALTMVIQDKPSNNDTYSNWGGLIVSGSGINTAYGQFNIAYDLEYVWYVYGAPSSLEYVSEWVGIGGVTSGSNLWQAGIIASVNTNGSVTLQAFAAAVTSNTYKEFDSPASFNHNLVEGHTMYVRVWYDASTGFSHWSIHNVNEGNAANAWFNGSYSFTPTGNTAEWVGEDPWDSSAQNYYVMPYFDFPITFAGLGVNGYSSLFAPLLNQYEQDAWCTDSGQTLVQQLIPGYVSGGDGFNLVDNQYTPSGGC